MTENTENMMQEVIAPTKRKAMVEYLAVLFAVAFLLVALSLLVKLNSMQEDLDAVNRGARENIAAMETQLESISRENKEMERSLRATELLTLAQAAYSREDPVSFQGYMAELEGYTDALSEDASEIYAALAEHLQ